MNARPRRHPELPDSDPRISRLSVLDDLRTRPAEPPGCAPAAPFRRPVTCFATTEPQTSDGSGRRPSGQSETFSETPKGRFRHPLPAVGVDQDVLDDLAGLLGCVDVLRGGPLRGEDVPNGLWLSSGCHRAGRGRRRGRRRPALPLGVDRGWVDHLCSDECPVRVTAICVDADLPEVHVRSTGRSSRASSAIFRQRRCEPHVRAASACLKAA